MSPAAPVLPPRRAERGPRGVDATTQVVIGRGRRGEVALTSLRSEPPLGVRLAGGEVHLMGTAGGPHGGDRLRLHVTVLAGTDVTVRSVAATVALPGDGSSSSQTTHVEVQDGASLRWLVEPLVVAADADHVSRTTVEIAPTATVVWREEIVLGRTGETPGRLAGHLRLTRDGQPLLHHGLAVGAPGWDGPAVTGGAGTVGVVAWLRPSAPGTPASQTTAHQSVAAPDLTTDVLGEQLVCNHLTPDLTLVSGVASDFARWRAQLEHVDPTWSR